MCRRMTLALLFVVIGGLACSRTDRPTITLNGTVRSADGSPPAVAHVHRAGDHGVETVAADPRGHFQLELPANRMVRLRVSAVDHEETAVPVFLESESGNGQLAVTLAPNPRPEAYEDLQIMGSFNDFSFTTAEPMEALLDGTFAWTGTVDGERLAYELFGVTTNGRWVNGTAADEYEVDGGGDYRSVLRVTPGTVTVVFDPKLVPRVSGAGLPRLEWDHAHQHLEEVDRLVRLFRAEHEAFFQALRARGPGHEEEPFVYDHSVLIARLREAKSGAVHPLVRAVAALELVNLPGAEPSADDLEAALALAPPDSPLWADGVDQVSLFASRLAAGDRARQAALLEEFLASSPEPEVRGAALVGLVSLAEEEDDESRWRELHARLKSEFAGTPKFDHWITRLDPDRAILPGKPIPAFAVDLIGGGRLTREELSGRWVLLDFWAVWCGPCKAEMPHLHQAYERFAPRGLEIVGLSFDGSPEVVEEYRRGRWAMPWRQAWVAGGFKSDLAKAFEIDGIPQAILVAPDGTIVAISPDTRGERLLSILERFLAGGSPADGEDPFPRIRSGQALLRSSG